MLLVVVGYVITHLVVMSLVCNVSSVLDHLVCIVLCM